MLANGGVKLFRLHIRCQSARRPTYEARVNMDSSGNAATPKTASGHTSATIAKHLASVNELP